jgi:multimeric flavodoxin WrbA
MKKICFINGSLRGKKASSLKIINEIDKRLDEKACKKEFITAKQKVDDGYPKETLRKIADSDAIIIVFPLFCYCVPGALMRLLEEYYGYAMQGNRYNKKTVVYAVVNCAYVEPEINMEAIRVIKNFCARLGVEWRFAVAIGCGPVTLLTKFMDFKLKKAFRTVAKDIWENSHPADGNIFIKPVPPRIIMDTIRMQLDRNALKKSQ